MLSSFRHPRIDELSDFLASPRDGARARIATHLERCGRCRGTLQLLRAAGQAAAEIPATNPPPALRARILAARAGGVRMILPTAELTERAPRHRRLLAVAAAVLIVVAAGVLLSGQRGEVQAGATAGTLTLTPALPEPGQPVEVRYAAGARLQGERWLALRARLRTPNDESYNEGLPTTTLTVLRRAANGTFTGRLVLPDSIVYAALAVEDSAGSIIDDNGGRAWELLTAVDGTPRFEALHARANDMMGRNWEEGFATARQMVALYPNDVDAWDWLKAFHVWLGRAGDDSVRALHRTRLAAFDSQFSRMGSIPDEIIGRMAWYARSVDSATAARWRARLMREAPRNRFAVQWRLFELLDALRTTKDTARAFAELEALWTDAPRASMGQVADYAANIAHATADTTLVHRWTARIVRSARDPRSAARGVATRFTTLPVLRREGMQRLRAELIALDTLSPSGRALGETVAEQRERHAAARRRVLAALGRALVDEGAYTAGLDTLAEASATGWAVDVFRTVYGASLAAGDGTGALTMAARLKVDPRTDTSFADSLRRFGERALGVDGWQKRLHAARAEFTERMLTTATPRPLPRSVRVRDLDGRAQDLRALANGRITVVVFWSRYCGPALDAVPQMNALASRLAGSGIRVIGIMEDPDPSAELRAFLREKQVSMPTYVDAWHEASRAFNQWGTPFYFLVDADGRIRFDGTSSPDVLLARAEALRLRDAARTASRR